MKKKIAVTGGIGSGKSYISNCLKELGYSVFSCDEIYKEVIQSPIYITEVSKIFPNCVLDGVIDRKKVSEEIFSNADKRAQLNAISHPLIMQKLCAYMDECASAYVFAEVPLLFEGKFENLFDGILVVYRNMQDRINSLINRDGISEEEISKRINAQFDYDAPASVERLKKCGAKLFENNTDKQKTKLRLQNLISTL